METTETRQEYQPSFEVVKDSFSQIREMVRIQMQGTILHFVQDLFSEELNELCGSPFSRKRGNRFHRGGSDPGSVILNGQRVAVRKPRVRNEGEEVELQTYRALQDYDLLCERVMKHMLSGVSTRDYEPLLDEVSGGLGLSKSSVSSAFKKGSQEALDLVNSRDLSKQNWVAILIDGVGFGERTVVAALGIDDRGKKLILGLREGNTESGEVCSDLLRALIERGISNVDEILFVIDGGKALRSSIKNVFGKHHPIQRCSLHKLRNLMDYTPKEHHAELNRRWKRLHGTIDIATAKREYQTLMHWLSQINAQATRSLEEAEEETMTIIKLNVPPLLRRTLYSTNSIESAFSMVIYRTKNVKNWKSGLDQVSRWAAVTLLEAEKKFTTVKGYKQLPILLSEMRKKNIDQKTEVA